MIAGSRCAKRIRLARSAPIASSSVTRVLHTCPPRRLAFALPVHDVSYATSSKPSTFDLRQKIEEQKYEELEEALRQSTPSYSRTWGCYIELLNFVGLYQIPLEIHQKVLRACSADPDRARMDFTKRFLAGGSPYSPHPHEARFKTVIQNIREAGHIPALEDYHWILQQFAAVGYHYGALRVLREISHIGLMPTSKSYGLCLQALCHRLGLPAGRTLRGKLINEAVMICNELVREMHTRNVPFSVATVDLIYRVLTKTMSMETLETMLKVAYGVDLSYPDRPPLEFWQGSEAGNATVNPAGLRTPLPFSLSALNTTIVVLGRLGNVSKLVQAFEVLTTPLPSQSTSAPASTFEDDEDEDFGLNRPAVASFALPSAEPNTFTYETLIRSVSEAGNHVFCRHYLLQAMSVDRKADRELRAACRTLPREQVLAPKVSVNRRMLLSVFSLANRHKKMELLRWVHVKTRRVISRKKSDIRFYTGIQETWMKAEVVAHSDANTPAKPAVPPSASSNATASGSSSQPHSEPAKLPKQPWFNVDLESEALPAEQPRKQFNVNLHLSLLKRDLENIETFERHVADVMGRNTQRIKERLGRRIWGQKSVYLRHTGRRQRIHPTEWLGKVNFRQTRVVENGVGAPKELEELPRTRRTPQGMSKGDFFTPSTPPRLSTHRH